MTAKIQREGVHAILSIDPGGTTGVGAIYVDLKKTRSATFENGIIKLKNREVRGSWQEQGKELAGIANRFLYTAQVENSLAMQNIHIVVEDFILQRRREGGATGNLTSIWVAASFVGFLSRDDVEVIWQIPSEGMFFKGLLKEYGLWSVGSAHERSANCHIIKRVDTLLG
jgi:hypothetical protein